MKWAEALYLGRDELAKQSGSWADGTPKVAGEQSASILLAADRAARAGNVPWDWFPVALAVLGYRTFGDRFRVDAIYGAQLMHEDQSQFLFDSLAKLAAELDRQGLAVPAGGGGMTEAFFGRKDGTQALTTLAAAAWPLLLAARARGDNPTWTNLWQQDHPGLPGQGQQPIVPPIPDRPPFQPPLPTVPAPDVGGGLVKLIVGIFIVRELLKTSR